jgi:hypothetical protein
VAIVALIVGAVDKRRVEARANVFCVHCIRVAGIVNPLHKVQTFK